MNERRTFKTMAPVFSAHDAIQSVGIEYTESHLSVHLPVCNIEVSRSHRLEFFKNNFTVS